MWQKIGTYIGGSILGAAAILFSYTANSQIIGSDHSISKIDISQLILLETIPGAITSGQKRVGYIIQAFCTAGLVVSFTEVRNSPSLFVLSGGSSDGVQGGSLDYRGIPYEGEIKIYSSDATCKHTAWVSDR